MDGGDHRNLGTFATAIASRADLVAQRMVEAYAAEVGGGALTAEARDHCRAVIEAWRTMAMDEAPLPDDFVAACRDFGSRHAEAAVGLNALLHACQSAARAFFEALVAEDANVDSAVLAAAFRLGFVITNEWSALLTESYMGDRQGSFSQARDAAQDFLSGLALGMVDERLESRARACGLDLDRDHAIIVLALDRLGTDGDGDNEARRQSVRRIVDSTQVTGFIGDLFVVAAQAEDAEAPGNMAEALERRLCSSEGSPEPILTVGRPGRGLKGLRVSLEEALAALDIARRLNLHGAVRYEDVLVPRLLLTSPQPTDELSRILDPIVGRNTTRGRELLRTLRTYLALGLSVQETCRVLDIHRNTLRYRLLSVEKLIGGRIKDRRLLLELALVSYDLRTGGALAPEATIESRSRAAARA